MGLNGKVAIVTGAASGIGKAIAVKLVADGAKVVIADLAADKAEAAAQVCGGEAIGVACDVSQEAEVERACQSAVDRFGGLDIVVNNAGLMTFTPLEQLTAADWTRVLGVDLMGAFYFTKQAFLRMKSGGAVVNVASVHAVRTEPNVAPYAAAKAAVLSLTRSASIEGKARSIRANAVLPGAVDTPMLWDNPNVKSGAEAVARDMVGKPAEIAAAVAFLASDEASFITGVALPVDGGRLARI